MLALLSKSRELLMLHKAQNLPVVSKHCLCPIHGRNLPLFKSPLTVSFDFGVRTLIFLKAPSHFAPLFDFDSDSLNEWFWLRFVLCFGIWEGLYVVSCARSCSLDLVCDASVTMRLLSVTTS